MGRSQQDYYVKHDRPKALFVKELKQNARRSCCADHLPAALAVVVESQFMPLAATLRVGELRPLCAHFASGAGLSRTGGKLSVERCAGHGGLRPSVAAPRGHLET